MVFPAGRAALPPSAAPIHTPATREIKVIRQAISRGPLDSPLLAAHPIVIPKPTPVVCPKIYAPSELPRLETSDDMEFMGLENRISNLSPDFKARAAIREGRPLRGRTIEPMDPIDPSASDQQTRTDRAAPLPLLMAAKKNAKRVIPVPLRPIA
jgi:hypothetical protein